MLARTAILVAGALMWGAGALSAQTSQPSADIRQLAFLTGNWSCTHASRSGSANQLPDSATVVHVRDAVGGHWLRLTYDAHADFHVAGYIGVDRSSGQFVESMVDSFGDHWASRSGSFSRDTLTFETPSTTKGESVTYRDVYIRQQPNRFVHLTETQGTDGAWVTTDAQICRRTP